MALGDDFANRFRVFREIVPNRDWGSMQTTERSPMALGDDFANYAKSFDMFFYRIYKYIHANF